MAVLDNVSPLLLLSVLIATGMLFTRLAKLTKLPTETGQLIGGILLGPYFLHMVSHQAFNQLWPIINFIMGLVGLTIGSHLDLVRLKNAGRRILWITFADLFAVMPLVFCGLYYIAGVSLQVSLLCSIIAGLTTPEVIIHIVMEKKARGILTKTILAVVALNNVIVLIIFYSVFHMIAHAGGFSLRNALIQPEIYLFESLILGGSVGLMLIMLSNKSRQNISFFSMVIFAVFITVGISETFHFSSLLSALFLGMIITNFSKHRGKFFSALTEIENEIYMIFFVLIGIHINFRVLYSAGIAGIILIILRFAGKYAGPWTGAYFAKTSNTVQHAVGFSLYPLSGLAIILILFISGNPAFSSISSEISGIILTAVIFFELIGPVMTSWVIRRSGEEAKNRLRLLDFLQEEYIVIHSKAGNKWNALEMMVDFLYKVHKCKDVEHNQLLKSVMDRERESSTGIGDNIAIPHAIIEGGPKIRGVIGIFKNGIDFQALDDRPVHIVILIATPKAHYDLHLNALATVAKIFGHNPDIKEQLIAAETPEKIFEILQNEEIEELNPFFED